MVGFQESEGEKKSHQLHGPKFMAVGKRVTTEGEACEMSSKQEMLKRVVPLVHKLGSVTIVLVTPTRDWECVSLLTQGSPRTKKVDDTNISFFPALELCVI